MSFTRENIEMLVSEHSDLFKEVNGFRPRYDLRWKKILQDPESFVAWIELMMKGLSEQAAWEAEREERERSEFSRKVEALGLNPKKYMHLCRGY